MSTIMLDNVKKSIDRQLRYLPAEQRTWFLTSVIKYCEHLLNAVQIGMFVSKGSEKTRHGSGERG